MVVYAATMAVIGLVPSAPVAAAAPIVSGLAWVAVLSTLSASAQVLLPAWARTCGLAYYRLVFMGGQALGAVGWGVVADRFGVGTAFVASAAGLLVTMLVGTRTLPMPAGPVDVGPAQVWADVPDVAVPGRDTGPVLITVEWRVDRENAEAFIEAMRPVGMSRRRAGASLWGLFEDMADPTLLLETFTVGSEREHLRLVMERETELDQELEARALALTRPGHRPRVRHVIWAYAPGRDEELSSFPP